MRTVPVVGCFRPRASCSRLAAADQAFGGSGRPDIVRRAVEQRGIQFAFQFLDRSRQRRLGQAKLVRRTGEIADAVERFEMA